MDIYEQITNKIVSAIEANPGDVKMPWHRKGDDISMPLNVASGNQYNGVNVIALWAQTVTELYQQHLWGTYKQWLSVGGQVRKGEKSSAIIFYKQIETYDDKGDMEKHPMLRMSFVFNLDQVDGYTLPVIEDHGPIDRIANVEAFVANTGATVKPGGAEAFFSPKEDAIYMPDEGRFHTGNSRTEAYYAVLLHELTHWSGHESRLDRQLKNRFGSEAYAMEELVAELGSAFLCGNLGISAEPRPDHAKYLNNWLRVLKSDKKAIFTASARAQEAAKFLTNGPS